MRHRCTLENPLKGRKYNGLAEGIPSRVRISVTQESEGVENTKDSIVDVEVMASNLKCFDYQSKPFQEVNLVSFEAIREYVSFLLGRYQALSHRAHKGKILDELCRNLNIHEKSPLR